MTLKVNLKACQNMYLLNSGNPIHANGIVNELSIKQNINPF